MKKTITKTVYISSECEPGLHPDDSGTLHFYPNLTTRVSSVPMPSGCVEEKWKVTVTLQKIERR